ncbi:MAG: AmmeMemoRadiSam system protein B, partial [archaeon]
MKTKETISEIRSSAVAGSFYPLNKQALEKQLDSFFEKTELEYKGEKILGIIVPHAGYIYSGQTAMYGYKQLYLDLLLRQEDSFKVIILAPAHKEYFKGISISNVDYFRTPLGDVKVNSSNIPFQAEEYVQKKEHSIEVQLPFLQYIFKKANKEFSIVPILVGDVNQEEIKRIAKDINNEITENTIIIVSSDLSHYLSEEQARKIDQITIHYILDSNAKSNSKLDACGEKPILLLQEIAKERKWNNFPVLLNYSNSGDTTKDKTAVVGYASISYTDNSTHLLLRLAHRSI